TRHHRERAHLHRRLDGFARARPRPEDRQGTVALARRCADGVAAGDLYLQGARIRRLRIRRQFDPVADGERSTHRVRAAAVTRLASIIKRPRRRRPTTGRWRRRSRRLRRTERARAEVASRRRSYLTASIAAFMKLFMSRNPRLRSRSMMIFA